MDNKKNTVLGRLKRLSLCTFVLVLTLCLSACPTFENDGGDCRKDLFGNCI